MQTSECRGGVVLLMIMTVETEYGNGDKDNGMTNNKMPSHKMMTVYCM